MIEYLKDLLEEMKLCKNDLIPVVTMNNINKKIMALDSAIEVLEKLRNEERREQHGDIK